jgi:hypothetical protein
LEGAARAGSVVEENVFGSLRNLNLTRFREVVLLVLVFCRKFVNVWLNLRWCEGISGQF